MPKTLIRALLRTDGTRVDYSEPVPLAELERLIGAAITDTVTLRHLGEPLRVMVVNDAGYEVALVQPEPGYFELQPCAARFPVNVEATRLYHAECEPNTTHQIVGDVFVCPDSDFAA